MDRTIPTLFAAGLLLAAVPLGTAHLTNPNGSTTSGLFTDGDVCRRNGGTTPCAMNWGVSGSYVMPGSLAGLISDDFPVYTPPATVFPLGYASVPNPLAYCDLEVGGSGGDGDGGLSDKLLDEEVVDGEANHPPTASGPLGAIIPGVGPIPDGTWDDGGIGCASHTSHYNGNHYLADVLDGTGTGPACDPPTTPFGDCPTPWEFNTFGCGGTAYAEDQVSSGAVWIEVQCLDINVVPFQVPGCLANDILRVLDPNFALGCDTNLAVPLLGTAPGPVIGCGNSAASSGSNYGRGGANTGAGIDYPTAMSPCNSVANAAVIVQNALDRRGSLLAHVPATVGWIDSNAGTGVSSNPGGAGTVPSLCAEAKYIGGAAVTYPCPPAPATGCHGAAVVVYVSGAPPQGQATGTATCGSGSVSVTAAYSSPRWDGVGAGQGPLTGSTPACSVVFTGSPNSATFAYAQCFIL